MGFTGSGCPLGGRGGVPCQGFLAGARVRQGLGGMAERQAVHVRAGGQAGGPTVLPLLRAAPANFFRPPPRVRAAWG